MGILFPELQILSCILSRQSLLTEWCPNMAHVGYIESCRMRIHLIFLPLATKVGAIVSGQTSVKAPEKAAFEKHLPQDVYIVSCHSLHGPTVSPQGQPLVSPVHWSLLMTL